MRLHERWLTEIRIAKRGAQSGSRETFSEETTVYRGACLPQGGSLKYTAGGAENGEKRLLILPKEAEAAVGDGAWVDGRLYLIERVDSLPGQKEVICRLL